MLAESKARIAHLELQVQHALQHSTETTINTVLEHSDQIIRTLEEHKTSLALLEAEVL